MELLKIKNRHRNKLIKKANVVSVGVGYKNGIVGEPCVVVGVTRKIPLDELSKKDRIPTTIGKAKTDVVETGPFKLLRTDRVRPVPPGVSIGHFEITAGTFGCVVERDELGGRHKYILSNNHVLANVNQGSPGDPILQPGAADGGTEENDTIGYLQEYIPIVTSNIISDCPVMGRLASIMNSLAGHIGSRKRLQVVSEDTNLFDAALASPAQEDIIVSDIVDIGVPVGPGEPILGAPVRKSGRTTGLTSGVITQVGATVQVQVGGGQVAVFEDQMLSDIPSDGGDSGAAVVNEYNEVVGLLFAGGGGSTVFSDIRHILQAYNVDISTE